MNENIITLDGFYDCDACMSENRDDSIRLKEDEPVCPIHGEAHEDCSDARLDEVLHRIADMFNADETEKATKWLEIATANVINQL